MSRSEWETFRRSRIESRRSIEVKVSRLETEVVGPDRVRVSFDQAYTSNVYSDDVRKTLELVRLDGRWAIVVEQSEG